MRLHFILLLFLFCKAERCFTQVLYKDSMFAVQKQEHVFYGIAINYAGSNDSLFLDLYKPIGNRTACRPLMVFVHGGAFIAGSSNDVFEAAMANYFASTGYVTASINYRLNNFKRSFYTPYALCNDLIYPPGFNKCVYVADTAEVLRGLYRAQQDTKGALRFLAKNALVDSINLNNVFIGGTSAGAITCLTTVFMDKAEEKFTDAVGIADAPTPDPYLTSCLPSSYVLARPDLGAINGDLHTDILMPNIKGIASFYGAVQQLPIIDTLNTPYLYLYHRTQDPIVDSGTRPAISGLYDYCYNPTNICQPLDHWPYLHGNFAISNYLTAIHYPSSKIMTRFIPNGSFCDGQGHSIDDWKLRSHEVMEFFYDELLRNNLACTNTGIESLQDNYLNIFPNPVTNRLTIGIRNIDQPIELIQIYSMSGQLVLEERIDPLSSLQSISLDVHEMEKGTYLVMGVLSNGEHKRSLLIVQ